MFQLVCIYISHNDIVDTEFILADDGPMAGQASLR